MAVIDASPRPDSTPDSTPDSPPSPRVCKRCGEVEVVFPDEYAFLCEPCHAARERERRDYQREYQSAKSRAVARLIRAHRAEFERLLFEERFPDDPDDDDG